MVAGPVFFTQEQEQTWPESLLVMTVGNASPSDVYVTESSPDVGR
jgi:hypothetical protein